jgi:hypothetical protein
MTAHFCAVGKRKSLRLNRYQVSLSDRSSIPQIRGRIALVQKTRFAQLFLMNYSVAKTPEADDLKCEPVVVKTWIKPTCTCRL